MKKIAAIIVSLCLCAGVLGDVKYTVSSKEIPENHIEETDSYSQSQKEQLKNTTQILDEILSEGTISDINLRMLVKRIFIHQNEDKSLDIRFEMNGEFNGTVSVFIEPTEELESA